jgi:hypothetical protein
VLYADLMTVGWQWNSSRQQAGITVYSRDARGVLVQDPEPGAVAGRPLFVVGRNDATGVELSARRQIGASAFTVSYARSSSMLEAEGRRYAAPWDRRTMLRVGSSVALSSATRWMTQYTLAAGAPFTRYYPGAPVCSTAGCQWFRAPSVGEPSAARAAETRGLDTSIEWVREHRSVRYGTYVQVQNLLRPRGGATYLESRGSCVTMPSPNGACDPLAGRWQRSEDTTLAGLPRAYSLGMRLVF